MEDDMALCWICREKMENYGIDAGKYLEKWPGEHCHHEEPEEKPVEKCWCNIWTFPTHIELTSGKVKILPKFCPQCGRKLA
jgi:hypothetical protein